MASAVVALAKGGSRGGHRLPMSKSYHKPSRRNYTSYLQPPRDGVGGGRSAGAKAVVGGGGGGVGDVRKPYLPSDDSFSMNRKSMSLNWNNPNGVSGGGGGSAGGGGGSGHSWESLDMKRNGVPQRPAVIGAAVGTTMTIPVSQMSKAERRELRRKLRWQLEQVKLLSMKLESRERQLKGISVSAAANPTFSDAQFSVNDVRPSCVGKEVTSELDHRAPSGGGGSNGFRNFPISGDDQSFRHSKKRMPQNGGGGGGGGGVNPKPSGHGVKRASMASIDGRDSKRPAGLSEEGMKNCFAVLRRLMTHKHGWVFNEPVDAVKLGLTDYHSVIKRPMDLGTIKGKLSRKEYTSASEFAADVRLTFSNAMVYNPWGHDVHSMADVLRCLFEERWRGFGSRCEDAALEVSDVPKSYRQPSPPPPPPALPIPLPTPPNQSYGRAEVSGQSQAHHHPKSKKAVAVATASTTKKPLPPALNKPKPKPKPARDMTFEEKKKLSADLQELPIDKLEHIVQIMKERNPNLSQKDDEIEVDIDTFDNETLWELHRFIGNCMKSMNQQASKAMGEKLRDPAEQVTPDGIAVERAKKGAPGDTVEEDDVDIDDDMPKESFAPVVIDKDAGYVSRSSSSGTSSSGSGSSSDSDSGSSSDSDSDAGGGDAEKRR